MLTRGVVLWLGVSWGTIAIADGLSGSHLQNTADSGSSLDHPVVPPASGVDHQLQGSMAHGSGMNHAAMKPDPGFDRDAALAVSQAVIGQRVGSHAFVRSDETPVNLLDYRGKPLVVSLIYTSCHHICPTTTQHLRRVVRKARAVLGTDAFNVISVGFDTARDSPEMMRFFGAQQVLTDANWDLLSADKATIDHLASDLGFLFRPSPAGFDHLIQATILTADGEIATQVYGMQFDTPLLVEPLKQMVFGTGASSLFADVSNQVRLFCTVYDPAQDKYKFDYSLFIGMFIGFGCVGVLGFSLIREWRRTLAHSN